MKSIFAAAICATMASTTPASADLPTGQLMAYYEQGGEVRRLSLLIVGGLSDGFLWSNVQLEMGRGEQKLFCLPDDVALGSGQVYDLVRRFVGKKPHYAGLPLGLSVLDALTDAFPCGEISR